MESSLPVPSTIDAGRVLFGMTQITHCGQGYRPVWLDARQWKLMP